MEAQDDAKLFFAKRRYSLHSRAKMFSAFAVQITEYVDTVQVSVNEYESNVAYIRKNNCNTPAVVLYVALKNILLFGRFAAHRSLRTPPPQHWKQMHLCTIARNVLFINRLRQK